MVFLRASLLLCLSLTVYGQKIEFDCPKPHGIFEHPEQCDRYFKCRNGIVTRKLCEDGLVFDPDKVTSEDPCDHKQNTKHKCRGKPKLQRPKPGDGYCPRQNGVYASPNPSECDKFYSCLKGVGSMQVCANGLHFDPDLGTCVWARESSRKGCSSANDPTPSNQRRQRQQQNNPQSNPTDSRVGESLPNGFGCPGGKLGIHPALPHPTSCRLYYVCLNGIKPNEAGCVSGLVFNSITAKCDKPENVPGCEDTYKPKRSSQPPPVIDRNSPLRPSFKQQNRNNEQSRGGGDLDVQQFAKFIELLTNPKVQSILKPEVVDALGVITDGPPPPTSSGRRNKRPKGGQRRPPSAREEEEEEVHEVEKEENRLNSNIREIPSHRRNKFTSRFIPR
ncbi:Putative chitinase 3like, partial [Caligus rogercresseyi]